MTLRQLLASARDSEPYSVGWTSAEGPENHRLVLRWLLTCDLSGLSELFFFFLKVIILN